MELAAQAGFSRYSVYIECKLEGMKSYQKQESHTNSKSQQRRYIHFQADPLFLWSNQSHVGRVSSYSVLLATDKFQG